MFVRRISQPATNDFFLTRLARPAVHTQLADMIAEKAKRFTALLNGGHDFSRAGPRVDFSGLRARANEVFPVVDRVVGIQLDVSPKVYTEHDAFVAALSDLVSLPGGSSRVGPYVNELLQGGSPDIDVCLGGDWARYVRKIMFSAEMMQQPPIVWAKLYKFGDTSLPFEYAMFINSTDDEAVDPRIVHEYAHVMQFERGWFDFEDGAENYGALQEGHACGVARLLCLGQELPVQGNRRVRNMGTVFAHDLDCYLSAYYHVALQEGLPMRGDIVRIISNLYSNGVLDGLNNHTLGNSLFAVSERNHGSEIYRRALEGDLEFLAT